MNQMYNNNDILLFEKSTVYYNYIKTEETIISNIISPKYISKSVNKQRNKSINKKKRKKSNKNKNKSKEENKNIIVEQKSILEDSGSQLMSFFPKKIEVGKKKLENKQKLRNAQSIRKISKPNINLSKENINENKLNKSTKLGNADLHLYELIEKIISKKDNESKEGIIRDNIKKLRNYCYQLRKKRKKIIKTSINKNNSSRKKLKKGEKNIERSKDKKRSTIINKDVVEKSLFLIKQQIEGKSNARNKLSLKVESSPYHSPKFNVRKKSTAKVIKLNLNNNKYKINIIPPDKNHTKNYSTLKNKERIKKLKSVNPFEESKFVNKLKKKKKKSLINDSKNNEDYVPLIHQIPKNLMRSTINEIRMKFDNLNNEEGDKKYIYNKLKFNNKKSVIKTNNMNLNISNNNPKKYSLKYFNSFGSKKDKIELRDNLANNNKSLQKIKKSSHEPIKKENSRKSQDNREEIIKLKKLSLVVDSGKKSKKKLIDSPDRRVYRYSNFTNYFNNTTNVTNTSNRLSNEKNNKKNKKIKEQS